MYKGQTLFIADLHLSPEIPETTALALRFLDACRGARALYVLGDLFEYWIGDDVGLSMYPSVVEYLTAVKESGCRVGVMHGNRDFLLGQTFADTCGVELNHQDEWVIELGQKTALLMHGDTLCTRDTAYLEFRNFVRDPVWQANFLAESVSNRQAIAQSMRNKSRVSGENKMLDIMDVDDAAAVKRLRQYDCHLLIHGHTHRPGIHVLDESADQSELKDGQTSQHAIRYVLGDWRPDGAEILRFDGQKLYLEHFA